jgi:plasmid stabilization system protein ParE
VKLAKISKRAQRDLDKIREHIRRDDPDAAERVRLALLETADLLAANVAAGQKILNAAPRH